jgi:hypothetical protein
MVFNVRTMSPKEPLNDTLIINNKDMEKTKDSMHKPSEASEPLAPHKIYVASFIYEVDWGRLSRSLCSMAPTLASFFGFGGHSS